MSDQELIGNFLKSAGAIIINDVSVDQIKEGSIIARVRSDDSECDSDFDIALMVVKKLNAMVLEGDNHNPGISVGSDQIYVSLDKSFGKILSYPDKGRKTLGNDITYSRLQKDGFYIIVPEQSEELYKLAMKIATAGKAAE